MGVQVIKEFATRMENAGCDLFTILDEVDKLANGNVTWISEEQDYKKITNHLSLEIVDIERFIKVNEFEQVTNPTFFIKPGEPTDDGLLSYKIFGITQDERSNIFGYIDLGKKFLHPLIYKAWCKVNPKIKNIIAKLDTYSIDSKGYIVQDPKGSNGIEFLVKNINKIKFEETGKVKKDISVRFLELNRSKNRMFLDKYLVIPPFYRDTNMQSSRKGSIGVGKINQLYQELLYVSIGIKTTQEYGFDLSGSNDMRLQNILVTIYDWFCGTTNSSISKDERGLGLSGKMGIYRLTNQSKTSDYAARLVISAPELKANTPADMMTNFDRSACPLAAVIAAFAPFVQYNMRQFFQREFMGTEQIPIINKDGKVEYKRIVDPMIQFSDEVILQQMDQYIHGYNNRFIPVTIQLEDGTTAKLQFKGRYKDIGDENESIYNRPLTWVDVLYMAAVESTQNRMALISRYPVDSRTNQIATEIEVATTNEVEPMYVDDKYYRYYPKITKDMIGMDTSNMFIDTLNLSNLYLAGLGGDYDGDTVTLRGVFTDEANDELKEFVKSKKNFIGPGGSNIRIVDSDTVQALYSFTKILPDDKNKLGIPKF